MLIIQLFEARRAVLLEARIDFLRGKFIPQITAAVAKHAIDIPEPLHNLIGATGEETAAKIFDYVATCDPDPQKKSLQWLLTLLMKGGFLLEDGAKAFDYLKTFNQVRAQLPANARDVNRVKTLADLYVLIEPLKDKAPVVSNRQAAKSIDQEMTEQSRILLNNAQYKVLIPLTKQASCYFGVNTQWCTAATTSTNYFDSYNSQGPLFIILEKATNTRWQFQPATRSFMDESDRPIDLKLFLQNHPDIAKLFVDLDGKPLAKVETLSGEKLVYSDGDGGYQIKDAPGLLTPPILRIVVKDGMLSSIGGSGRRGTDPSTVITQSRMADLLNHLRVKGNETAQATEDTYMLYYREPAASAIGQASLPIEGRARWGSLYELASPFMQLSNGWQWKTLSASNAEIGTWGEYVLMSPEVLKATAAGKGVRDADRAAMVASAFANGEFGVSEYLGSQKEVKQIDEVASNALLKLVLQLPVEKWLKDVVNSDDLHPADGKILLENKPALCGVGVLYKVQGVTDLLKKKIDDELSGADVESTDEWTGNDLIVETWDNIEDCVASIGNDHAKWLAELSSGNESIDIYDHPDAEEDDIRQFLDKLDKETQQKLSAWTVENYADEIEEYREDEGLEEDEFDVNKMRDLAQFFYTKEIPDIIEAANNAHRTGAQYGAEAEAHKSLMSAIKDAPLVYLDAEKGEWDPEPSWDVKVGLAIDAAKIVSLVDNQELDDVRYSGWTDFLGIKIDASEPYYGYSDYDQEAAQEEFENNLPL